MPYHIRWLFTKYCYNQQEQTGYFTKILFPKQGRTIASIEKTTVTSKATLNSSKRTDQQALLQKNLLLKHLCSKLVCLESQQDNINKLLEFLSNNDVGEVVISGKNSNYYKKIDLQQEVITNFEIVESAIYWFRKYIHLSTLPELTNKLLSKGEKSISSGLSLLKTGQALPCLLPLS